MKKFSLLIIAAVVFTLGMASEAYAQYWIGNGSPVGITAQVYVNCGGVISLVPAAPIGVAPGTVAPIFIPAGCTVVGARINGTGYPMGYNGPAAPPNPPTTIIVTPARTAVM